MRPTVAVLKWMARAPAERMTLPSAVVVLAAAEMMHVEEIPPADVAIGSLVVAGVAAVGMRNRRHGRQLAATAAVAGGWLTWAVHAGPLAGHDHPLTWAWGTLAAGGYVALMRHDAIKERRLRRKARIDWREWRADAYGLSNSFLLHYEQTRLGEAFTVDTRETGRRASHLAQGGDLAEVIAEREMLPVSRVQVRTGRIAGRIRINIRYQDPWEHAPLHPVLNPPGDVDMPVPCSILDPPVIGIDPDTGNPLQLPVVEKSGTKNVLVVGIKGAGKSVLLNNLRERITASDDAVVWDINVSKALEDLEWEPACDIAAVTDEEQRQAIHILKLARGVIGYRSRQPRETANFVPTAADPLVVLIIDEVDSVVELPGVKADLKYIASKCRSEGVALVLAGQRATADWIGGADVRANIDLVCVGKVNRAAEVRHAVGDIGLTLPDMTKYGEGAEGVWLITDLAGNWTAGRTFDLETPADLRQLAAERAATRPTLPTGLVEYLGDAYAALKAYRGLVHAHLPHPASEAASGGGSAEPPAPGGGTAVGVLDLPDPDPFTALTSNLEIELPDDLRAALNDLGGKLNDARRIHAETGQIDVPEADPETIKDVHRQLWAAAIESAKLTPDQLGSLYAFCARPDGATIPSAAAHLGVTSWIARCGLEALRDKGLVRVDGKGRGARWRALPEPGNERTET